MPFSIKQPHGLKLNLFDAPFGATDTENRIPAFRIAYSVSHSARFVKGFVILDKYYFRICPLRGKLFVKLTKTRSNAVKKALPRSSARKVCFASQDPDAA